MLALVAQGERIGDEGDGSGWWIEGIFIVERKSFGDLERHGNWIVVLERNRSLLIRQMGEMSDVFDSTSN